MGNGGRGNAQLYKEATHVDDKAQCYAFPSKNEADAFDTVITGTILAFDHMANELFDPSSNDSYVFLRFASEFEMLFDVFHAPIRASTLVGESIIFTHVYQD